jgi:hypothetical protein
MSWEPRHDYLPFKPFRENVKAVILRDMAAAVEWASKEQGGLEESLPVFLGVHSSRAVRPDYPVVNLLPLAGDPEQDDDNTTREKRQILVEVETLDDDSDGLIEQLELYVLAVRSMLTEMSEDDLTANGVIDPDDPSPTRGDFRWSVGRERYGERVYDGENTFVQVGSLVLTIEYDEEEQPDE